MTRHSLKKIEELAKACGYRVIKHEDANGYYYTLKHNEEYILKNQRNFKKIDKIFTLLKCIISTY